MTALAGRDLPGVIGHELRNPLASAVTTISLLGQLVDAEDPRRSMVDQALVDLDRMTDLIDGWLTMSRSGTIGSAPVEIDSLLLQARNRHGALLASDRVGVTVEGDRVLLERALDNLLDNARQVGATRLRLAAQVLEDEVSIHVEDNGPGIAEADLARVFEPGWSGRGGNGLGLYAVSTTMQAHHGRVHCVRLARGTRFTLRLPIAHSHAASA